MNSHSEIRDGLVAAVASLPDWTQSGSDPVAFPNGSTVQDRHFVVHVASTDFSPRQRKHQHFAADSLVQLKWVSRLRVDAKSEDLTRAYDQIDEVLRRVRLVSAMAFNAERFAQTRDDSGAWIVSQIDFRILHSIDISPAPSLPVNPI